MPPGCRLGLVGGSASPPAQAGRHYQQERAPLRIRTLLLLWVGIIVVFFSLSQTKQDLYIFPIVAAIAALGGDWVARALAGDAAEAWLTPRLTVFGIVLIVLGGVVLYLFGGDPLYPSTATLWQQR